MEITLPNIFRNSRSNGRSVGCVSVKELGYDFPEIPRVFIGDCGSTDVHYAYDFGMLGGAHTHMCNLDSLYNCVCVSDKEFIIPEIMWHEYAHVLMKKPKPKKCSPKNLHEVIFDSIEELNSWNKGHTPEWSKLIQQFGFPAREHIPYDEVLSYGSR